MNRGEEIAFPFDSWYTVMSLPVWRAEAVGGVMIFK